MKELILELVADYERSYWKFEKLERATFDSDYSEDYENTVERLYEQGYSDALAKVIRLLEKGAN
jgi:hypothetical protein